MKKLLLVLAVMPMLSVSALAFTPSKQHCQALKKDVITVMSYVVPCGEDLQSPAIFHEHQKAKSVIDERLKMCEEAFSQTQQETQMDELLVEIAQDTQDWEKRIATNKSAFCQSQRVNVVERLLSYS